MAACEDAFYACNGRRPQVDAEAFVAPGARLVGDVRVAAGASIWFNAVLRAEAAPIVVGRRSNVQDGCVLHSETGRPCLIGEGVTVGHGAIVHGCRVEDGAVVGMAVTLLNDCHVGAGAVVAAGALVPEGQSVPPGMVAAGIPARVLREVRPEEVERFRRGVDIYVESAAAQRHLDVRGGGA